MRNVYVCTHLLIAASPTGEGGIKRGALKTVKVDRDARNRKRTQQAGQIYVSFDVAEQSL